jgi:hypothetical protein
MRSIAIALVLCLTIIGITLTRTWSYQDMDSHYAAAYEKWNRAIESNSSLGEPFWLRTDIGPPELRSAVEQLLSFGPNITPFVVKQLRNEKDPARLYRLVLLLNLVSGVNLYFDSGAQSFYEAAPQFRDRFVADWDSGKYLNATGLLRNTWQSNSQNPTPDKIDPKRLTQIRRYGVFAIPFIIENIESQNSAELFAAFLIITGKSDLYTDYLENPLNQFTARDQKLSLMKSWARENENKLDKVPGLNERIKALVPGQ